MKDIDFKQLLKQWKDVLLGTFLLICQVVIKSAKWMWKELVHFYNVTPWNKVHPYIFVTLFAMMCVNWYFDNKNNAYVIDTFAIDNAILRNCLDSIQTDCEYNYLQVKAGEYAMFPHKEKSVLTKDSLASLLVELNAWYPDIIMAQVETESGFGVSALAKRANNVIGMKKTSSRRTTQIKGKETNSFGIYNNWESCIIDRILWDHSVFGSHKPTRQQYVQKLNNVYAYGSGVAGYGDKMNANSKKFRDFF